MANKRQRAERKASMEARTFNGLDRLQPKAYRAARPNPVTIVRSRPPMGEGGKQGPTLNTRAWDAGLDSIRCGGESYGRHSRRPDPTIHRPSESPRKAAHQGAASAGE